MPDGFKFEQVEEREGHVFVAAVEALAAHGEVDQVTVQLQALNSPVLAQLSACSNLC